jgi:SRSO17 transposase
VLVIDDSGDRKDGAATAHVGRQWLGLYGKTDNGIVTVTTLWPDEQVHYPLQALPYTPARHFPKGKNAPAFRTKLQIGAELARQTGQAGFGFRAVAAGSAYGDQTTSAANYAGPGCRLSWPSSRHGIWAYGSDAYTPADAARIQD